MPTALRYINMSPAVPSGLCKSLSCSLLYSTSEADCVHADVPWLLQSISHEQCLCRDHVCRHVMLCSIAWQNSTLLLTLQAVLAEVLAQVVAYKMGDATL